jgi:hypothetical protein
LQITAFAELNRLLIPFRISPLTQYICQNKSLHTSFLYIHICSDMKTHTNTASFSSYHKSSQTIWLNHALLSYRKIQDSDEVRKTKPQPISVPVCPHAGGVGLCEMVQHLQIFDYICLTGTTEGRMIEFASQQHEHFENPVRIKHAHYIAPKVSLKPNSCERVWGWKCGKEISNYSQVHTECCIAVHLAVVNVDDVRCLWTVATSRPTVHPPGDWYMRMESHNGTILTGENQRTRRKTCPSANLSTTNPAWTKPDLHGETGN